MEWIYGRNVVQMALTAGARRRAHRLAATPPALKALRPSLPPELPVEAVDTHALDELTGSRDHQGVALQVDAFAYATADEVLGAEIVVVLDEVSDPRNLGATARSALAAGAGALVVPKHRSASVTPAAVKASAGTIEHLPVAQVTNVVSFLKAATSGTPAHSMNCFVRSVASFLVLHQLVGPLWAIAFWKSPLAWGRPISTKTLIAPADSPMMVMLSGSPPNRAILFLSQRSAMTWSWMPLDPDP